MPTTRHTRLTLAAPAAVRAGVVAVAIAAPS
jgi:hypothetical protein